MGSSGCAGPFTAVSTWGSVADFVAEVAVIPPVQRLTRTERSANACGGRATTLTYTYDAQHRLTQSQPEGISYMAWDGFGRPTAGTSVSGANLTSWSFSYANSARIKTQTSILNGGAPTVVTTTFDVNGNAIGMNGPGTTVVTTILSTATVCW
jgi:YD repeat-containing protein